MVQLAAIAKTEKEWELDGYTVNYEAPQNVLLPTKAATIATTGVSSIDPSSLIATKLWGFVDEYTEFKDMEEMDDPPGVLDDGRMEFGRFFVVSCSTLDLAHYICSKSPIIGTPYELTYELNDRGLIPAERAKDMENKRNTEVQERRDTASKAAYQLVRE